MSEGFRGAAELPELLERRDMRLILDRLRTRELPEISRLRVGEFKRFVSELHACMIRGGIGYHCRQRAHVVLSRTEKPRYTYLSPHVEDQDFLIQKMLDASRRIPNPRDVGLLLYVLTNIIHGLQDGNGRMARFFYGLLNELSGQDMQRLVAHGQGANARGDMRAYVKDPREINGMIIRDMIPRHCNGYVQATGSVSQSALDSLHESGLPARILDELKVVLSEERLGELPEYQIRDLILFAFSLLHPEISADKYEESRAGQLACIFDADQLVSSLSEQQANELLGIARMMKRDFALTAIDIIENPFDHLDQNGGFSKDSRYA